MSDKNFKRQNWKKKNLDGSWRRPRGHHSSLRKGKNGNRKKPSPGYGSPNKGMHPSGYFEVLVKNKKDLDEINKSEEAARISSRVGKRKKNKIRKEAEEREIKILN